jgi:hypothetical protein
VKRAVGGWCFLALSLVSLTASAQIARPIGETPGELSPDPVLTPPPLPPPVAPAPAPAPATEVGVSLVDKTKPERFSRFSAGKGGPLFAFSEVLAGLVIGGVLGVAATPSGGNPLVLPQGAYLGALTGGLLLGALGTGIQYFQPIGLLTAGAAAMGLATGALAGLGVYQLLASFIPGLSPLIPGLLMLVGSQAGAFAPLAILWSVDDLPAADLAVMGAGVLYAFALTALVNLASGLPLSAAAWLISPVIGFALGGAVAAGTDISLGAVMLQTGLPLGVGLAVLYLGGVLANSFQIAAITSLAAIAVTFGVTWLVSASAPPPPPKPGASPVTVTPTMTLAPAGRRNEGLAAGPALLVTF